MSASVSVFVWLNVRAFFSRWGSYQIEVCLSVFEVGRDQCACVCGIISGKRLINSLNLLLSVSCHEQFVADGVFYAELNEFLQRQLGADGYSGVEVRITPVRTEVIIRATRTQNVLGEKGRRIRELTLLVQQRFKFPVRITFVVALSNCSDCAVC